MREEVKADELTDPRTVLAGELYASYWPSLLRSDSKASVGVPRSVKAGSLFRKLTMGILSVASVVTPLGLYDEVLPSTSISQQPFGYTADNSTMGQGTAPRSNLSFNRICGGQSSGILSNQSTVISACPGSPPFATNSSIPQDIFDVFQSGLANLSPTVSGPWDIQWRSYNIFSKPTVNSGQSYVVGSYRPMEVMALNNAIQPVEGLIVDTVNGGIGFRNHTTPSPLALGSTWSEDLLFLEPSTVCVDLNLTLDFTLTQSKASSYLANDETGIQVGAVVLTDRGGFANLNQTFPGYVNLPDPQEDLDLEGRAYVAAWLNNAYTMAYLNVTNPHNGDEKPFSYLKSHVGQQFVMPLPQDEDASAWNYDTLTTIPDFGAYLSLSSGFSTNSSNSNVTYPNPFHVSPGKFTDISEFSHPYGLLFCVR
jgi:hypothetical protein